jgi:asparagine synthase (glutamine-hydrolysing)
MCGIAGILHLDGRPAAATSIRAMCAAMAHRGPDDEGVAVEGAVGLGHRRLSIIDLSAAAHQPMTDDTGDLVVSYNGEIYNFRELRARYVAEGHRFRSQSDTEVLLRAYAAEGVECVHRLSGIFAFALWDRRARRLVLARDRFGVKPLYYRVEPHRIVFASEVKAILAATPDTPRVCLPALVEYFTFQNVLSDLTLFDGVRLLRPGTILIVEDGAIETRAYWDLAPSPEDRGPAHAARSVREAFEAAVERQLVSDVPVGSYLSGGMDSASIVAVASRKIPRLATFTGGFDLTSVSGLELAFDERTDAEHVASRCGTEHYEMVLHAGDMAAALPDVIWHLEDLRVGMSYQNYYIARLASRFVKVVLAGVGGDELFAGYPWRYGPIADVADENEFEARYYRTWCRLIPDGERARFFTPAVTGQVDAAAPRESFREVLGAAKGWHPLDKALYFDSKTFLHGLLVVEDKLAMAHGLESRVPFLDDEFVQVAAAVPAAYKLAGGTGKVVLREALKGLLPDAILDKQKQGFSPPDQSWYRGPSMRYLQEILLGARALDRGWIEPAFVREVVDAHVTGRHNHRLLLWSLLCFEWWQRLFIDGDRGALPNRTHAGRRP